MIPRSTSCGPGRWGTSWSRASARRASRCGWPATRGNAVRDQSLVLLFNANREPVTFVLRGRRVGDGWEVLVDTATVPGGTAITSRAAASVQLTGRSIMVLRGVGADRTSRRPY